MKNAIPVLFIVSLFQVFDATAIAKDVQIGSWKVSETRDPITDDVQIFAKTHNSSGAFAIICKKGVARGRLSLARLGAQRDDVFRMLVRVDDGDVTKAGVHALSPEVLTFGISRSTYEKFSHAYKISLRLKVSETVTRDVTFQLAGTADAMSRVLSRCPISSARDIAVEKYTPGQRLEAPAEMKALVEKERKEQAHPAQPGSPDKLAPSLETQKSI